MIVLLRNLCMTKKKRNSFKIDFLKICIYTSKYVRKVLWTHLNFWVFSNLSLNEKKVQTKVSLLSVEEHFYSRHDIYFTHGICNRESLQLNLLNSWKTDNFKLIFNPCTTTHVRNYFLYIREFVQILINLKS